MDKNVVVKLDSSRLEHHAKKPVKTINSSTITESATNVQSMKSSQMADVPVSTITLETTTLESVSSHVPLLNSSIKEDALNAH